MSVGWTIVFVIVSLLTAALVFLCWFLGRRSLQFQAVLDANVDDLELLDDELREIRSKVVYDATPEIVKLHAAVGEVQRRLAAYVSTVRDGGHSALSKSRLKTLRENRPVVV